MNLTELPLGTVAVVLTIGGTGTFRRRLMELGMVPGTRVEVRSASPFGDPLELLLRGSSLSIRRADAHSVEVEALAVHETAEGRSLRGKTTVDLVTRGCARGGP